MTARYLAYDHQLRVLINKKLSVYSTYWHDDVYILR